jgi:hypothetical protein
MALVPFTLTTAMILDNTPVTGNGIFDLWISPEQANSGDYEAIKLVIEYSAMTPDPNGPNNSQYSLSAILEGKGGAFWTPLLRQFNVTVNPLQGLRQILVVAPNIFTFDEGIPVDDFDGEKVTTRMNKSQGRLTDDWRLRVEVRENKFGVTGDAFESVTVNVYGDRYNV